jgi:hypothetical protein
MSDATSSSDEAEPGVLIEVRDKVLAPFHYATSKPARRVYLSTFLFLFTSLVLFCPAALAYILFYRNYIPTQGFTRPIYLQFDSHHIGINNAPWGITDLGREIVSGQPYDVKVVLHMPRTPTNIKAGNFMVDLRLLSPLLPGLANEPAETLVRSRRPAILKYYSVAMEHVHNAAGLPLHLLGWRRESEILEVGMMEDVEFDKGWRNLPNRARVELQSSMEEGSLQVYEARLVFTARLKGLRYIMYKYWFTSFVVLTFAFWMVEMSVAGIVFFAFTWLYAQRGDEEDHLGRKVLIKKEGGTARKGSSEEKLFSDTERILPSPGPREHSIRYTSPIPKQEETEIKLEPDEPPIPPEVEADDEDEDADFVIEEVAGRRTFDSGLGTSLESSAAAGGRRDGVRRRSGRFMKSDAD